MCNIDVMTVQEAADICKVSLRTVFRWLCEGKLPAVRIGNVTRIRRVDLEAFFEDYLSETPSWQPLHKQRKQPLAE